jgi:hypothetical protein
LRVWSSSVSVARQPRKKSLHCRGASEQKKFVKFV